VQEEGPGRQAAERPPPSQRSVFAAEALQLVVSNRAIHLRDLYFGVLHLVNWKKIDASNKSLMFLLHVFGRNDVSNTKICDEKS
jgi:hypothetical protein